jgi:hypothetical protein
VSLTFPTLPSGSKPDSHQFTQTAEDPAMRTDIEGGYVVSRPKHTRTPRKNWGIAYQQLTAADKTALDAHWDAAHGGSLIFDWTNPENSVVYQVRFKDPLTWRYVGIGPTKLWDCSFSLEQA